MLSVQRQATYWAIALTATLTYRLLPSIDTNSSFFLTHAQLRCLALAALLFGAIEDILVQRTDLLATLPPMRRHRLPNGTLIYYLLMALLLLSTGEFVKGCPSLWRGADPGQRGLKEGVLHTLLGFLVVAEMEYWRSDVVRDGALLPGPRLAGANDVGQKGDKADLYLTKSLNFIQPTPMDSVRRFRNICGVDERSFTALVLDIIELLLWQIPNLIVMTVLRYVLFGDAGGEFFVSGLLGRAPDWSVMTWAIDVVAGAPLRCLSESLTLMFLRRIGVIVTDADDD